MATSAEANIVIRVVDEASKAIGEVNKNLKGMGGYLEQHKAQFRQVGLVAVAAGGAIVGALGLTIASARESIQTEKQLNAVLESTKGAAGLTAEELKKMASSFQSVTNFGDEAVLGAETIILQFTKIGKDVFPRVTEAALDIAQRLGKDLPQVSLALSKALNDPIDAMNSLSRVGVNFSEAQQAVIKRMAETGDMAGAQKFILDELGKSYGGAARTGADGFTQLKNTIDDLQEEIGKALVPAIDSVLSSLKPLLEKVTQWIIANPELTKVIVLTVAAIGGLLLVLGTLGLAIGGVISALSALAFLFGPAGIVGLGIVAALFLIQQLVTGWRDFGDAIVVIMDAVNAKITSSFEYVRGIVQGIIDFLKNSLSTILNIAGGSASKVMSFVPGITKRAGGGRVNEDMTLVGERGPELVSLPRGSYVHTNAETRGMMSPQIKVTIGSVNNEADEDRLISKIARMIQLQQLASL